MLFLRLFLLVMFIGQSESTGRTVPNCDVLTSMSCLVPLVCKEPSGDPTELISIDQTKKISETCDVIAKIRSYSAKYILMVLESYNEEIDTLILEQGNTNFECKRIGDKVTVFYSNGEEPIRLLSHKSSPLSCEFTVNDQTNDIFDSTSTDLMLLSSFSKGVQQSDCNMPIVDFRIPSKPTCNPQNAKVVKSGAVGDNLISPVDGKLADLKCPTGSRLMYRENSASNFAEASTLTCKRKKNDFGYSPKPISPATDQFFVSTFEAQCEVPICTLCQLTAISDPNLKYEPENGCNKLKCKEGRIKIGSSEPVDGSAECKYVNDKPVWQVKDGTIITNDAEVICSKKLNCDITEAKRLCGQELGKSCLLDIHNLPTCLGKRKLRFGEMKVDVLCNHDTGKHIVKSAENKEFPADVIMLSCDETTSSPSIDPGIIVGGCVGLVILLCAICAIVGIRYCMNKKETSGAIPKVVIIEKQAPSKSGNSIKSEKCEGVPHKPDPKLEAIDNAQVVDNPVKPAEVVKHEKIQNGLPEGAGIAADTVHAREAETTGMNGHSGVSGVSEEPIRSWRSKIRGETSGTRRQSESETR